MNTLAACLLWTVIKVVTPASQEEGMQDTVDTVDMLKL